MGPLNVSSNSRLTTVQYSKTGTCRWKASSKCWIAPWSKRRVERLSRKHEVHPEPTGLLDRVEGRIVSSSELENGKPVLDVFLHVARTMGVAPNIARSLNSACPEQLVAFQPEWLCSVLPMALRALRVLGETASGCLREWNYPRDSLVRVVTCEFSAAAEIPGQKSYSLVNSRSRDRPLCIRCASLRHRNARLDQLVKTAQPSEDHRS